MKGKTKDGFEFDVDESILDDWELAEDLVDAETNGAAGIRAAHRIFGNGDAYNRLKDSCRDKNGRVSSRKMYEKITEVLAAAAPKNS